MSLSKSKKIFWIVVFSAVIIEVYLDYRNNYLSVQGYADRNELSVEFAKVLIDEATRTYKSIYG